MKMFILLGCIGSTQPSSFSEICQALDTEGERPAKGDKAAWREFFEAIRDAERKGFIETERESGGNFESAMLTEAGVAELNKARSIG